VSQLTDIIATKRAEFEAAAGAFIADQVVKAAQDASNAASARVQLCSLLAKGVAGTLSAGEQTSLGNLILRGNVNSIEELGQAIELLLFYRANPSEQHDQAKRELLFTPSSVLQREGFVKPGDSGELIHE
jgi:hypothetical protein